MSLIRSPGPGCGRHVPAAPLAPGFAVPGAGLLLGLMCLFPCAHAWGAQLQPPRVGVSPDGLLWVRAQNSTVAEVLQAIAQEAGFGLQVEGGAGAVRRGWVLEGRPLLEGIRQITRGHGLVVWHRQREGPKAGDIVKIRLLLRGPPQAAASDRTVANGGPGQGNPDDAPGRDSSGGAVTPPVWYLGSDLAQVYGILDHADSLPAEQALGIFSAGLASPLPFLREDILDRLEQMGGDGAVLMLAQVALGDPDRRVRQRARDILRRLGHPNAGLFVGAGE